MTQFRTLLQLRGTLDEECHVLSLHAHTDYMSTKHQKSLVMSTVHNSHQACSSQNHAIRLVKASIHETGEAVHTHCRASQAGV